MLLTAAPEEEYCIKSQKHSLAKQAKYVICYRCMLMVGRAKELHLGSLLDY